MLMMRTRDQTNVHTLLPSRWLLPKAKLAAYCEMFLQMLSTSKGQELTIIHTGTQGAIAQEMETYEPTASLNRHHKAA